MILGWDDGGDGGDSGDVDGVAGHHRRVKESDDGHHYMSVKWVCEWVLWTMLVIVMVLGPPSHG